MFTSYQRDWLAEVLVEKGHMVYTIGPFGTIATMFIVATRNRSY